MALLNLLEAVDAAFVGLQDLGQAVCIIVKQQLAGFQIAACGDTQVLGLVREGAQHQQLLALGFPGVAVEGIA